MTVKELRIAFVDNPDGFYMAGQTVNGQVFLRVIGEPLKNRGVKVYFVGEATVKWTERKSRTRDGETEHYTETYRNSETYFDAQVLVSGNGTESYLQPGDYSFPFSFLLPQNIPSSFEGPYGNVRYYVKAAVDRPWRIDDSTIMLFTVNAALDLNREFSARNPGSVSDSKNFCCCCCKHGPLSTTMNISRLGYVPGDSVLVTAEVHNNSKKNISKTTLNLMQRVVFRARNKSRDVQNVISSTSHPGITPGESSGFRNCPVYIPPLPPSHLGHCSIIDIEYFIMYEVVPSGIGISLTLRQPILIGNIPLREVFSSYQATNDQLPMEPSKDVTVPSAPPFPFCLEYPDLPPPSYAEAVGTATLPLNADNNGEDGSADEETATTNFMPKYFVFNSKQQ